MIKTAISLLMSFIMLIFNTIGAALPGFVPKAKSESELTGLTDIFDVHPLAREIAVVQSSKTSDDELAAIICLQGLVSRDEASIFINYGYDSQTELNDLRVQAANCFIPTPTATHGGSKASFAATHLISMTMGMCYLQAKMTATKSTWRLTLHRSTAGLQFHNPWSISQRLRVLKSLRI